MINSSDTDNENRTAALEAWLSSTGRAVDGGLEPASDDASFRRYFRWNEGGKSFIVMDAPPPQEDCRPFVEIAGYLEDMGLNAPRVIDADLDNGFLLLTDLGDRQFLDVLRADPGCADDLYRDAIDTLVVLQRRGAKYQGSLPPYDRKLLEFELALFHDWLCERHLGLEWNDEDESHWKATCDLLVRNAMEQPRVFVHRDYHSRNLMLSERDNPGILDFQDAVEGPLSYDLVSLLKDCYVRWPPGRVDSWLEHYFAQLDVATRAGLAADAFRNNFELMGVQRHLKAAGIFARLNHRDGKSRYLADIPLTLGYVVDLRGRHPDLGFLVDWIEQRVLPAFGASA